MIASIPVVGSATSISRVGFGCGRIFGASEYKASARLIEAALRAGIRHFDTAPSYGEGLSESVLGSVLCGVHDATVTTKVGIPRPVARATNMKSQIYRATLRPLLARFPGLKNELLHVAGRLSASRADTRSRRTLTREEILRNLERSLLELKRSSIDLYLVHEPDQFEITDEAREVFTTLMRDGVIGAYGLAYDTYTASYGPFGTVCQSRYPFKAPDPGAVTPIFHGLLRHGWNAGQAASHTRTPGDWIAHVLTSHPGSAVIFSASSHRQIESVMENLN
jgi:predicted aldo/keto reductase-like oxidoreductase